MSGRLMTTLLCLALSACSTLTHQRREQELAILTARNQQLTDTNQRLTATPDPHTHAHAALFISFAALNRALSLADGTIVKGVCAASDPNCRLSDVSLFLDRVRISTVDGSPAVTVKAWAKRGSVSVEVELQGSLIIAADPQNPELLDLAIAVDGIDPTIRFPWLTWPVHGLLRDLLLTQAQTYADALPKMKLPIRKVFPFHFAGINQDLEFPVGQGSIAGNLHSGSFDTEVKIKVSDYYVLPDGVHVFLAME